MQAVLVQQGVDLTLYGMGIVFLFLTLLVICTMIMSRIIDSFFPDVAPAVVVPVDASPRDIDPKLLAVIQAAIQEHRARTR